MHIFTKIADLRSFLQAPEQLAQTKGLVPTMGALHEGHISLINKSLEQNKLTICSIFVNPIQFNNAADLEKYPRTLDQDCALLEAAGCHVVFAPDVAEMYHQTPVIAMQFGSLETVMEGAYRPGHFSGVGVVVSKLFNIVQPTRAYFGQKDFQQLAIIKQMVKDLSFPIEIVPCTILRAEDGLALSSRNKRLSPEERALAPTIYRILTVAAQKLQAGESILHTKQWVVEQFSDADAFTLEYFEIADADTLQPVENDASTSSSVLCVAAYLGNVRLIDNILL